MASTNKTTNYELSQYIGNDKPTYLGDYNSDMLKIDTGMKANETASTANAGSISTINNNIGTMSSLETTASNLVGAINEVKGTGDTNATNITNVDNKIGDLANLESTVKTNVVNAINSVIENFNLTNIENFSGNSISVSNGTLVGGSLTVASNQEGSIAKIYGGLNIRCNGTASPNVSIQTDLRPATNISINSSVICLNGSSNFIPAYSNLEISTAGVVSFRVWNTQSINNAQYNCILTPCIYYIKDFGDIPITPII